MLEPLASSVLTSIFSVRPPVAASYTSHLSLRTMTRTLSADFFTPHPRRAKGKERASASEECSACGSSSGGAGASTSSLGARTTAVRAAIPGRPRTRRLSTQRPFADAPRGRIPVLQSWHQTNTLVQRRHASSQPKAVPTLARHPNTDAWREEVIEAAHAQGGQSFESALDAYNKLCQYHASDTLEVEVILHFMDRLTTNAQIRKMVPNTSAQPGWKQAGRQVQKLLHELEHRIPDDDHDQLRRHWQIEMIRALALRGQLDEALSMVRKFHEQPPTFQERFLLVPMHHTVVTALRAFRGAEAVLRYVVDEWDAIATYVEKRSVIVSDKRTTIPGAKELQLYVFKCIGRIQSPSNILVEGRAKSSPAWRQRAGEVLIDVFTSRNLPLEAVSVHRELYKQGLHAPGHQQLLLVRALAKAGAYEVANPMFATLQKSLRDEHGQLGRDQYETGLYLFSRQGDIERTKEYFKLCRNEGSNDSQAIAQLIHAFAVNGDAPQAVAFFNQYCYDDSTPQPNRVPANIVHYTSVIYAHARRGDRDGMNVWLEKMALAGFAPDLTLYNIILQLFASRGEIVSVGAVLDQMRASGCKPDHYSYTTIISALAKRQDPVAAEALYRQALDEGVVPDRHMVTALLNAHVEAGSWQGVVNAFDYLVARSQLSRIDLSIEVYNTLIKAYVLIGAPFDVVFKHFHRLEAMNVRPNDHTYALVMQSACDSGNIGVAEKLYYGVRQMSQNWEYGVRLNVYMLTILLSGFLRTGQKRKAKLTYQNMIKMNIRPTSITFHSIIKAYANPRNEESIKVALQFIQDLLEVDKEDQDWLKGNGTTGSVMDHIYGPLLNTYSQMKRPEELESLLQELFDRGGQPTLYNLTALLDVYRRTKNVEGAQEVWSQIYQLALETANVDSLFIDKQAPQDDYQQPGARRQGNVLCIPLSMYIDVLSAHGLHAEIAKTWQQMKDAGFMFDAHNWNHLAVALTRAGDPLRAFEILERVVIPYRNAVTALSDERDASPASPLLTDRELPTDDRRPPVVWPQTSARRIGTQHFTRRNALLDTQVHDRPADFAHQLHVLHQVSPVWRSWRPHMETLVVLANVLEHLHSGNVVQALRPAEAAPRPATTVQEAEEREARAQEVLGQIYEQCPRAVDYVVRFIEWRKVHKNKVPRHLR